MNDPVSLTKPGESVSFSFIPRDAPWASVERFWFLPISDSLVLVELTVDDAGQLVGAAPASLFTPDSPLMRSLVLPTVWATTGCSFTLENRSAEPMDVTVAVQWRPGE